MKSSIIASLLLVANAESNVNGALFRDPLNLPETCPTDWGTLMKTYLPGSKQASLTVPCSLDDKECLGKWPGVKAWVENGENKKYDHDKVFVFSHPDSAVPALHLTADFDVQCRGYKFSDDGKRKGIGLESKFTMKQVKLETQKVQD